jgi:hypothetical protein
MPAIAGSVPLLADRISEGLPELLAPVSDGFIANPSCYLV